MLSFGMSASPGWSLVPAAAGRPMIRHLLLHQSSRVCRACNLAMAPCKAAQAYANGSV